MTAKPAPAKPSRARRRWGCAVLLVLLLILALLIGRLVMQLTATPEYWQTNRDFLDKTPPPQLAQMAREVETRLPSEWTQPIGEGSGERKVRVQFDEVNAWLALRLPQYLENQDLKLPRQIGQTMLSQRDGELVLAFDYVSPNWGQRIASIFVSLAQPEGKPVQLGISRARAGEQNLPLKYIFNALREVQAFREPPASTVLDRLSKGEKIELPPLPVDDHREAVVRGIEVTPLWIEVDLLVRFTDESKR